MRNEQCLGFHVLQCVSNYENYEYVLSGMSILILLWRREWYEK
jgi:hypothetical protein